MTDKYCQEICLSYLSPVKNNTGCSSETDNCIIPFIFYLILFLALFLLFLSFIYGAVFLLSGKSCPNSNHNGAKVRASH